MKILKCLFLFLALAAFPSFAVTISQWTFESPNTPADVSNSGTGPNVAASAGAGTVSGLHASAGSDWTTPAGNGSTESLSANEWAVGDYWQFQLSTLGYSGISVAFDQVGSATGPRDFNLRYSTDGSTFTTFASYSLPSAVTSWSSGSANPLSSFSFNLSSVIGLDNMSAVYFRLVDASTTSVSGGTVGTAGTDRIDNVAVSGTAIQQSVPETLSGLFAALALIGVLMISTRMRSKVLQPIRAKSRRGRSVSAPD